MQHATRQEMTDQKLYHFKQNQYLRNVDLPKKIEQKQFNYVYVLLEGTFTPDISPSCIILWWTDIFASISKLQHCRRACAPASGSSESSKHRIAYSVRNCARRNFRLSLKISQHSTTTPNNQLKVFTNHAAREETLCYDYKIKYRILCKSDRNAIIN